MDKMQQNRASQSAYRARQREAGYRQTQIFVRDEDVAAGREAAMAGLSLADCPTGRDLMSWVYGFAKQAQKTGK